VCLSSEAITTTNTTLSSLSLYELLIFPQYSTYDPAYVCVAIHFSSFIFDIKGLTKAVKKRGTHILFYFYFNDNILKFVNETNY